MSSEPTDNPGDKPGRFDSPVPDSWAQPVPDSWASESWPPQPDGSGGPPAPPRWPGHQGQQVPPSAGPAAAGQQGQQTPPPAGPAASGQQSQPAGQFAQAGAGQSPNGQYQVPTYGQYRPDGQHATDGQHPTDGQYPRTGQYPPAGQYPPPGQFLPGGQYPPGAYGDQWQYFTPPVARANRAAVAALVCGIGQFVLGLTLVGNILLAVPAIICGSIALKQIRLRGERGHGMAVAGLVLGILGVLYFLLILVVILIGVRVTNH